MDQRTQGGPTTPPPLSATAPAGEREKEGVGGKKEEEDEKRKKEREGPQSQSQSESGAGTEGTPGDPSQQPQQQLPPQQSPQFSVKEATYAEGNVKMKIGLQAKRMKKPPKIMEDYVCRPAFRATVRHTGRGGGRGSRGAGGANDTTTTTTTTAANASATTTATTTTTANATTPGGPTQSPSLGKESEKSQSAGTRPAPPPAQTPPHQAPPTSTSPITPVNGSPPAKRAPPKLVSKSESKPEGKATASAERPLNLHRPLPDSKLHSSTKKAPLAQPNAALANSSPSPPAPPAPSNHEPKMDGVMMKPPQFAFGEAQREQDRGVPGWGGSSTVTEKLAQLIATCPPTKCPKQPKVRRPSPSPSHSNSVPLISNLQRPERAMANRATYSRIQHLSPPPPVSRPPGRPYGSRNKDSVMDKLTTSSRKEESDGGVKGNASSGSSISCTATATTTTAATSSALHYGNSRTNHSK
ncbi:hypothetical protein AALO_G00253440 [Alosa alosa]|uniref:Uncharacterized protein n=2 Tax=Alosa alosa TaxID=278164 RepID=A0AAV6FNV3_9TELE|nr:hypothetical protein AALO_G00253440 [Alosa alosa]